MSKRVRLDYLDIAKAITIFLVVVGHAVPNDYYPYYRLVLYTFHMPLFFMVSGVVVRRHRHEYDKNHWLDFFRKNIIGLVIPYFLWAIIYTSLDYTKLPSIAYASWAKLNEIGTLTSLWFLPCLFTARVLMELLMMFSTRFEKINRHLFAFILAIIMFAIGLNLPTIEMGYPWCFNSACTALGFMLMGYSFKGLFDNKSMKFLIAHLIIYVLIFVLYLNYIGDDLPYIRMFDNNITDYLTFFVMGISGCGIILCLSRIIAILWSKTDTAIERFTLWVGRSTIGIFLLHKPFLQEVVMPLLNSMGMNSEAFSTALLGAIIAFIYSCIMIKIIERYIPQLFGKFNNEKTLIIKEEN